MKNITRTNKNMVNINRAIYVDYENIIKRLKNYGIHPVNDLDFFKVIGEICRTIDSNILKYVVYGNFSNNDLTQIESQGFSEIRNCNESEMTPDLLLTIDVLSDLIMKDNINEFIIISSEKNLINLVKAIECENKCVCIISTKDEFTDVTNMCLDHHKYIEDIFDFNKNGIVLQ